MPEERKAKTEQYIRVLLRAFHLLICQYVGLSAWDNKFYYPNTTKTCPQVAHVSNIREARDFIPFLDRNRFPGISIIRQRLKKRRSQLFFVATAVTPFLIAWRLQLDTIELREIELRELLEFQMFCFDRADTLMQDKLSSMRLALGCYQRNRAGSGLILPTRNFLRRAV